MRPRLSDQDHRNVRRIGCRTAWGAAVAAAVSLGLTMLSGAQPVAAAAPSAATPVAPAYTGDFPDPGMLFAGGTYYAYSTQVGATNVPVMRSADLIQWSATWDALPKLPGWASPGSTWAPSVVPRSGGYLLYYTVRQTSSGRQCISVATAAAPGGPFTDTSRGPLVCQLPRGGSIDPSVFTDKNGRSYLVWKSDDNALGHPTSLWSQPLASSGTGFAAFSSPTRLLTQTAAWQAPAIEGPSMVQSGSTYYLFYGANDWDSATSGIGYATCSSPLGPCRDRTTSAPWLATSPGGSPPIGPQGPAVFRDGAGRTRLAFAAWAGTVGYPTGVRALFIGTLSFSNGTPTLN